MADRRHAIALLDALGATFAFMLAAAGLSYLLRGLVELPGPHLEAAPLDELSKRGNAPLLLVAGIWVCAGILIAATLPSRWSVGRVIAYVAAFTLAWQLLTTTISLRLVRQVSTTTAIVGALELAVIYVAPCFAALGAAFARQRFAR